MVSYIDKKMREAAQGSDDFEQAFKLAVAANQTGGRRLTPAFLAILAEKILSKLKSDPT